MKIFFAGIIQGSKLGLAVHSQEYRHRIKSSIVRKYPTAEIFDPFEGHEHSVYYDDNKAKEIFLEHLNEVRSSDLVIAYLPEASLGTAIELWEAYRHEVPVISISPMTTNWVIRITSRLNFETVEDFERFLSEVDLSRIVAIKAAEEV